MPAHIILLALLSLCCYDAILVIRYDRAFRDYEKRLQVFPFATSFSDPLKKFSLRSKKKLCKAVATATKFVFLSYFYTMPSNKGSDQLINLAYLQDVPLEFFKYEKRYIRTRMNFKLVNLLPCIYSQTETIFLTFGLQDKQMFLLENPDKGQNIKGIIEPNALIKKDLSFHVLLRSLRHILETGPNWENHDIPDEMKLCHLSREEHVRLCSSVFQVLSNQDNQYFQKDLRNLNYVRIPQRCVTRSIWLGANKYTDLVKVTPCTMNRKATRRHYHQFYVIADPLGPGSVFVFIYDQVKYNRIKLVALVERVPVLLDLQMEL